MKIPQVKDLKIKCICCEKDITPVLLDDDDCPADIGNWSRASVDRLTCGFGSIHDMSIFIIGICDDCLTKKHKDGVVQQIYDFGDYLQDNPPKPLTGDIIEALEQTWQDISEE